VPRNLTSGFIEHATARENRPIILFQADLDGSSLRLWNGVANLSWDGAEWLGNGWLQGVEGASETPEVEATTMRVIISGVPAAFVSLVLNSQKRGAEGRLYIGFLDSSDAVVNSPYLWWLGRYSHSEFDDSGAEISASLHYTSPLVDMDRPNENRWNNVSQRRFYPGDRGFRYIRSAAKWNGSWGN
jgi:hypothetical protein